MTASGRAVSVLVFLVVAPSPGFAQESRIQIGAKAGLTIERSEDNLTGTVLAFGLTVAPAFTPHWRGEFEFWLPEYLKDATGAPKHRDILYSLSAIRPFRAGSVKPFVLAGLSFSRTEDRLTICSADRPAPGGGLVRALVSCDEPDVIDTRHDRHISNGLYALAGVGIEIPIGRHLNLIADVRLALAPTSVLVRPGVGIAFAF